MSGPSNEVNEALLALLSESAAVGGSGAGGGCGAATRALAAGGKCSVDVKFSSPVATLPMKKIVQAV